MAAIRLGTHLTVHPQFSYDDGPHFRPVSFAEALGPFVIRYMSIGRAVGKAFQGLQQTTLYMDELNRAAPHFTWELNPPIPPTPEEQPVKNNRGRYKKRKQIEPEYVHLTRQKRR